MQENKYSCHVRRDVTTRSGQGGFAALWELRAHIVAFLVRDMGLNVLVSDLDAIWLQNPLPYLNTLKGDILALRGIGAWGVSKANTGRHVLNHGFVLFRSSAGMLMTKYTEAVKQAGHDQVGLNNMLGAAESRCQWNSENNEGFSNAVCGPWSEGEGGHATVSYTHLTLPTILLV